jgi:hypothetical protein
VVGEAGEAEEDGRSDFLFLDASQTQLNPQFIINIKFSGIRRERAFERFLLSDIPTLCHFNNKEAKASE